MRLKIPNPLMPEELGLDCLYVDPDIKVLRETTDPGRGLVNVQDQPMPVNMSQCRQLFYTKDYKCRQVYITGDAGMGKSIFCKHLVDLWCKSDSELVTNAAINSENSDRNSESCEAEYSDSDGFSSGDSDGGDGASDDRDCDSTSGDMDNDLASGDSDSGGGASGDSDSRAFSLFQTKQQKRDGKKKAEKKRLEEDRIMSEEDRRIMSEFKLLFYITLRESLDMYHVADMIDYQILQLDEEIQHPKASVLLKKVPCLVIIDGLDEWLCPADAKIRPFVKPGIPGRDWLNKSTVFLTTTRPWKFDVLQLTSNEVDKHVDLVGFNRSSSITLCSKMIKLLKMKERVQRIKGTFQAELRRKGLSHLRNIPVILTQLICQWFDKQDLGESQVQLYCNMLEMLLKRADKRLLASTPEAGRKEMRLPECFLKHKHCQEHSYLLFSLCKLALEALFDQKREKALVFESSQLEILGVDQNNVDLYLKSGILTQSRILGKWSVSEKKLSFLHKKLQEFLAAVFITYCENAEPVIFRIKQFCTSVESMLEMSQVWMFLSGIKYDVAKQLLEDLMTSVVLKDSRLQQYRQTLEDPALAQSIQTCILDCVGGATCNGHTDPCLSLEDFVINKQTISTCLERLLTFNTAAIKSVYINTDDMTRDTVERVMCQLQDTHCLQKLYLRDFSHDITNMQPLCKTLVNNINSLTCLQLWCITLTTVLYDAVCLVLNHVTVLDLVYVTLTHEQIKQLLLSVSQAQHIRQLQLLLDCTDHDRQCRAGIDLSGLAQLHTLELWYMYVKHLPSVTRGMKLVVLHCVTIAERQLQQFIQALPSTSNTLKVELDRVTVTGDSDNPVNLHDLKYNPKLVVTGCQYNDSDNTWSTGGTKSKQKNKQNTPFSELLLKTFNEPTFIEGFVPVIQGLMFPLINQAIETTVKASQEALVDLKNSNKQLHDLIKKQMDTLEEQAVALKQKDEQIEDLQHKNNKLRDRCERSEKGN